MDMKKVDHRIRSIVARNHKQSDLVLGQLDLWEITMPDLIQIVTRPVSFLLKAVIYANLYIKNTTASAVLATRTDKKATESVCGQDIFLKITFFTPL